MIEPGDASGRVGTDGDAAVAALGSMRTVALPDLAGEDERAEFEAGLAILAGLVRRLAATHDVP